MELLIKTVQNKFEELDQELTELKKGLKEVGNLEDANA